MSFSDLFNCSSLAEAYACYLAFMGESWRIKVEYRPRDGCYCATTENCVFTKYGESSTRALEGIQREILRSHFETLILRDDMVSTSNLNVKGKFSHTSSGLMFSLLHPVAKRWSSYQYVGEPEKIVEKASIFALMPPYCFKFNY